MSRLLLALLLFSRLAWANPEPDVPVYCHFDKDSSVTVRIEIDPRCFTDDPMAERYLMKVDLNYRSKESLEQLKTQAADAVARWVQFVPEPASELKPVFTFVFTGQNQAALMKADDPVVITATCTLRPSTPLRSLRIKATSEARWSVVVRYDLDGIEQPRFATLFAGETSFAMQRP
jgi:hypothetical protein